MIVFYGSRTYGKVDQVPGLFYVATKFFYIQFVPLVPTESYLIFDGTETENNFRGCRIPLSGKSILFAWGRLALFVGGIVAAILAIVELTRIAEGRSNWITVTVAALSAVLSIWLFWASYRFAHAGPMRALRIAQHAGIPPEVLAQYFVDAKGLSPEQDIQDALPADSGH